MRINKYLAYCGVCSRREADRLIESGQVCVNGRPAVFGDQITKADEVTVNGKPVHVPSARSYYAFYKPYGVICSFAEKEKNSLRRFTDPKYTYAGRLDVQSEGLLLLTDDGDLIHELMTGRMGHEKEYTVTAKNRIEEDQLEMLRKGMYLKELDKTTRPCEAWASGEKEFHIILTQGMNRQIRRMCAIAGIQIETLKRIRIENILLGDLKPGEKRKCTKAEITELLRRTGSGTNHR